MIARPDALGGNHGQNFTEPLVALLGTSLSFSDRMVRVLVSEFSGVRFERHCEPGAILESPIHPRLVILHDSLPDLGSLMERLQATFPGSKLAVACNDVAQVRRLNHPAPAVRFSVLQTNTQIDVWMSVLRLLLCGHDYVPADILMAWSEDAAKAVTPPAPKPKAEQVASPLTPRELQILPLIARGMQNKTIAGELGLSEHTVKLHTHNIFAKLKVPNRTGAANWYLSQVEGSSGAGSGAHAT